jgi:hypothetical protein
MRKPHCPWRNEVSRHSGTGPARQLSIGSGDTGGYRYGSSSFYIDILQDAPCHAWSPENDHVSPASGGPLHGAGVPAEYQQSHLVMLE